MMSYQRNGRTPAPETTVNENGEEQVRVDGFQQVLELLRAADPEFRESLLRRLAARDGKLARSLIRDLGR